MTNSPETYDVGVKAAVDALAALLNSGFIDIYTGTQPAVDGALTGTKLVRLTFGATAFANSTASGSGATATANAITSGTASAGGTAAYFALVKSDGTTVVGTGTCGVSGSDLNLSTTTIAASDTVSCSSFTITMPQT